MIPEFNEYGNLPPGEHTATLDEIESRFAYNFRRIKLFTDLVNLVNDLKKIGCHTIYVDGSFTTEKTLPKDIDICWDNRNIDLNTVKSIMPILFDLKPPRIAQQMKYIADILPAYFTDNTTKKTFLDFFKTDKLSNQPKGIIKIEIV
ncbi:MAG: hypothetical protein EOO07_18875 [Chitinophagaceae bacterium]|nr:MAG: hypothetical protein EOO07_18875 [Chitinophagaceae bacterium]